MSERAQRDFDLIEPRTWKKSSSMPHSRASFSFMPKSADHCNFGLVLFNGMERKASDSVSTSGQLVCSSLIWSLRGISRNPITSRKTKKDLGDEKTFFPLQKETMSHTKAELDSVGCIHSPGTRHSPHLSPQTVSKIPTKYTKLKNKIHLESV
jgi:hypothetical protein